MQYTVKTREQAATLYKDLLKGLEDGKRYTVESKISNRRTLSQNNALHLFCRNLAEALNAAGLDQRAVLKPGVEIPWTQEAVKHSLWAPVQNAMIGKQSTADAGKTEYSGVYDVLMRHLSEKFGIHEEWPTNEKL